MKRSARDDFEGFCRLEGSQSIPLRSKTSRLDEDNHVRHANRKARKHQASARQEEEAYSLDGTQRHSTAVMLYSLTMLSPPLLSFSFSPHPSPHPRFRSLYPAACHWGALEWASILERSQLIFFIRAGISVIIPGDRGGGGKDGSLDGFRFFRDFF